MVTGKIANFDTLRIDTLGRWTPHALFAAHLLVVGAIIATNSETLPEKILLWAGLPLFVVDLAVRSSIAPRPIDPLTAMMRSWILWAAVAYVGVLILSTFLSLGMAPAIGRRLRVYILWGFELTLLLAITAHLANTYTNFFKRLFLTLGVLLAINAAANIAAFFQSLEPLSLAGIFKSRMTGVFGTPPYWNATHLAPLLAIYAVALLGLGATSHLSRLETFVIAICVPILLVGILLTQSRAAICAVMACVILIAFVASWRWQVVTAVVAVVGVVALWASPSFRDAMLLRGTSLRPGLWDAYLNFARAHPWLGYGLDRWLYVQIEGIDFEQPHNTLIWAQIRGGIAASVLAAVMLVGSLVTTFRWWLKTSNIAPFIAVVAFAIISTTEIGFLVLPVAWPTVVFWLPVGLGAGAELACRASSSAAAALHRPQTASYFLEKIFGVTNPKWARAQGVSRVTTTSASRRDIAERLPAVLITGASSGIGATYAERFARRGHDLVLVARAGTRLEKLASDLRAATGVAIDIMRADLTERRDLAAVEARLRSDHRIGILVNNAGAASPGSFVNPDLDAAEKLINLNITSVVRLAGAVVPRFLAEGGGAIINISSALALVPESSLGIYGATKSFVLAFSQNMQAELGPRGVYVQAVLPAATATEIWQRSGRDPNAIPSLMDVGALVDAALVGFDRREAITIPPLPDVSQWETFEANRRAMAPNFRQKFPAARYRK